MSMRASAFLALASSALAITGCQHYAIAPTVGCDFTPMLTAQREPGPVIVAPVPGTMTEVPLNSVSFTDRSITNKVLVQSTGARRTPTNTVEVMVRVVNCTDFPLQIEARTNFLTPEQAPAEPVSAWQRVFLAARSLNTYQEKSISTSQVGSFLVEMREGR
jgi:hypothetical protein